MLVDLQFHKSLYTQLPSKDGLNKPVDDNHLVLALVADARSVSAALSFVSPNCVEMSWNEFSGVFASSVAALLGAWGGAAIAFRKFRRERTFDRRLEWLLIALETIHSLEAVTNQIPWDTDDRGETYREAREEFNRMIAQSPAFMSQQRALRLRIIGSALWKYERQTREFIRAGEEFDLVSQAVGQESAALGDAEAIVLKSIHRLMPPERDFTSVRTLRGKVSRLVRKGRDSN